MQAERCPVYVLIEYCLTDWFPRGSIVISTDQMVLHRPIELAGVIGPWNRCFETTFFERIIAFGPISDINSLTQPGTKTRPGHLGTVILRFTPLWLWHSIPHCTRKKSRLCVGHWLI